METENKSDVLSKEQKNQEEMMRMEGMDDTEIAEITEIFPPWVTVSAKGKLTVNEVEFCKMFLQNRELKCICGQFRNLQGEVDEEEIKHEIADIIMTKITEGIYSKVKSVVGALKLRCYSEPPEVKENEIHLLNGILQTNGVFTPEQHFCTNRLNVEYDSSVPPPEMFINFLSDLLEPDDIITLQEYLGYLLIPSTKGQAMLSIIGNGGEGKSVLGTIIKDIFTDSMAESSFRRIETDRFFRANLKGKLVFVDDDLQLEALPSTGYIKSLITVQIPTDIEFKGKQSYSEKLYARFLCFGNGTIRSLYDKSLGFNRRMIILSAKPVPENRVNNPNIAEEIIAEKAGIINWLFAGLQRLLANNYKFTLSQKARLNAAEMSSDNCNIIEFLSDKSCIVFSETAEISSAVLYCGYLKWCEENALTPLKRETFITWLKTNQHKYSISYDFNIKGESCKRVRGFKGMILKAS